MIFGQLAGRSPEGKTRTLIKSINQTPLYHMSCLQLSRVRLHYDDVLYQNAHVSKIIIIAQITHFEKGVSARGMAMLNIRLQDSTAKSLVSFYYSEELQVLCREVRGYVKLAIAVKCAGMVYKPQIKFIGVSLAEVTDFNELTSHFLQCIKTSIKTQ